MVASLNKDVEVSEKTDAKAKPDCDGYYVVQEIIFHVYAY
jgi:hypothetical protein